MIARSGRLVLLGAALLVAFALSTVLAHAIPSARVEPNVRASAEQLRLEGHPYAPLVGLWSLMPDNFTDALMLNQALNAGDLGPVQAAFGNYMQMAGPSTEQPLADLDAAVAGRGSPLSYARYWHGYQVLLRPLLAFFDLRAIRFINAVTLMACVAFASVVLSYRLGLKAMAAFLVALLSTGIVMVPMSIQFSSVFYVMLLGVVAVTLGMNGEGRLRFDLETFLVLGALTAFFDLLTAPVLTLGLPLAVLLVGRMRSERESRFSRQLLVAARVSAVWAIAYVGCWAAKWALSSLAQDRNVLMEVASRFGDQMTGTVAGVVPHRLETIVLNVSMLFPLFGFNQSVGLQWSVVAATCAVPALAAIMVAFTMMRNRRTDNRLARLTGLLPVTVLPFAWFLMLNIHSWVHPWMTYRMLAISVFVAVYGVLYAFDPAYLGGTKMRAVRFLRGETQVT